jgi:hypothetical protein
MTKVKRNRSATARRGRLYHLLVLLSCLVATSCGTKTFPRPEQQIPPPQIKDASAEVHPKGVELSWTMPDQMITKVKGKFFQFVIQKADVSWENRNCLDCPATFQDKQVIDPLRPEPALKQGKKFTWRDTGVSREHAYRYQIAVRNEQGRIVAVSNGVAVKVLTPPAILPKVAAVTEAQGILVRWQKPPKEQTPTAAQGRLHYQVERSLSGKTPKWEAISPVPVDGLEFLDTAVASDQSYDYRVTPVLVFEETQIFGEPATFNMAKAPETVTPPPPQSVWVVPGKGQLEVHWLESEGKVLGYHVYRRQGQDIIRLTANPLNHAPFSDKAAKKNETYFYAVSAVSPGPQFREGLLSKWIEVHNVFAE